MRISPAAVNADDANTTRRTVSIHDERHNHRTTPQASSAGTMSEGRLTIVVVALSILTFLGILSETSLNIAYSTLMGEFAISADVVQWAHHRLSAAPVHSLPTSSVPWCAHSPPRGARHCRGAVLRQVRWSARSP